MWRRELSAPPVRRHKVRRLSYILAGCGFVQAFQSDWVVEVGGPTTAGRRPPGTESTPLYKVHVHPANSTKMSPNTDSCSHFKLTTPKSKDSYHYGYCCCIYTQCIPQENKCYKKNNILRQETH